MVNKRLTGAQLRAARGLLAMSAEELAKESGLSLRTMRRVEKGHGTVQIKDGTENKIVSLLEARGVIFVPADSAGEGVRLRIDPPPMFAKDPN